METVSYRQFSLQFSIGTQPGSQDRVTGQVLLLFVPSLHWRQDAPNLGLWRAADCGLQDWYPSQSAAQNLAIHIPLYPIAFYINCTASTHPLMKYQTREDQILKSISASSLPGKTSLNIITNYTYFPGQVGGLEPLMHFLPNKDVLKHSFLFVFDFISCAATLYTVLIVRSFVRC